jgi:hypothetical protein
MIRDILENGGYRKKELLELILEWGEIEEWVYEVDIWPYDYMNYFCSSSWWKDHDKLLGFLLDLELRCVIKDFKRDDNFDGYGADDLISGWFTDSETWKADTSITNEMAELFLKYWWKYRISCNKEKVKLFYDIVFWEKKYKCTIVTLKALLKFLPFIDREAVIDWIDLEEKYIFIDEEVQLKSILTSNFEKIAKLYYYISKHIDPFDWERFMRGPLEFEENIITEDNSNFAPELYKKWYDKYLVKKIEQKELNYIETTDRNWAWNIKYHYDTKQLQIWSKLIHFKWAKLQTTLLEYLIKNSDRSVSSIEVKNIWITDMKYTIDDIKDKLKKYKVSQKECKELFHYFEEAGIKYCRILL